MITSADVENIRRYWETAPQALMIRYPARFDIRNLLDFIDQQNAEITALRASLDAATTTVQQQAATVDVAPGDDGDDGELAPFGLLP